MFDISVPRSGLSYSASYERREAARWAGYKYEEAFCELDGDEQSAIIAHYRAHMQADAVLAKDLEDRRRRAERRNRPKGPK